MSPCCLSDQPIVLMGGGTTKIGDPSGKDEARKLITYDQIQQNLDSISKVGPPSVCHAMASSFPYSSVHLCLSLASVYSCQVFHKFLKFGDGPTDAQMVNNDDWLSSLSYLDFLRDYGQHFTINRMLNFESVKLRLSREQPLTFLEFNYMILQVEKFTT